MLRTMFYPKNVPNWERIIRIVIGLGLVALAFSGQSALSRLGPAGQIISVITAFVVVFTGFFGWCPMCALVGRKIRKTQST